MNVIYFLLFSKYISSFILNPTYDNIKLIVRRSTLFTCSIIAVHKNKQAKFLIISLLDALIFFQPLQLGRHQGTSWL